MILECVRKEWKAKLSKWWTLQYWNVNPSFKWIDLSCGKLWPVQRGKAPSRTSIETVAADSVTEHLQLLTVTDPCVSLKSSSSLLCISKKVSIMWVIFVFLFCLHDADSPTVMMEFTGADVLVTSIRLLLFETMALQGNIDNIYGMRACPYQDHTTGGAVTLLQLLLDSIQLTQIQSI